MTLKQKLGKRIKMIRKSRHLKQYELADLIGVDPKTISKIEKGYNYPSAETLEKLSQELDVCIWDFYVFEEIKSFERMKSEINLAINEDQQVLLYVYHLIRSIKDFKNLKRS